MEWLSGHRQELVATASFWDIENNFRLLTTMPWFRMTHLHPLTGDLVFNPMSPQGSFHIQITSAYGFSFERHLFAPAIFLFDIVGVEWLWPVKKWLSSIVIMTHSAVRWWPSLFSWGPSPPLERVQEPIHRDSTSAYSHVRWLPSWYHWAMENTWCPEEQDLGEVPRSATWSAWHTEESRPLGRCSFEVE